MKVSLAGAFGNLGSEILKELVFNKYEVVACDMAERDLGIDRSLYKFVKIDVTNPKSLDGICDGCDVVISTVGLTKTSIISNYDIDYKGNLNILNEAKKANVKHFVYISVIKANEASDVPMVNAKYLFEEELKKSNISYVIHRPTGYFYDIVKVFKPMVLKGSVSLLGKNDFSCNVVDTFDFAKFIVSTMLENNKMYNVGGKETYTYKEIAEMCFDACGKKTVIKRTPVWLFSVLAKLPKNKKNGKLAIIKFSKFTLTNDLIGDTKIGERSFKKYIYSNIKKEA